MKKIFKQILAVLCVGTLLLSCGVLPALAEEKIDTTVAAAFSPAFQSGYAMILDETAVYREEMPTDQLLTTLYAGMTVYVRGRVNAGQAQDQLSIVFHTSQGLQFGFISAKNARPYSRQETFAFSASLIDDSEAGDYNGHLLKKLSCQIIPPAEKTADETEQTENEPAEVTEEEAAPAEPQQPEQAEEPAAKEEPTGGSEQKIDTTAAAAFSPAFQSGYAMILDETAVYREEAPTDQVLTTLYAGMTVYVNGRINAGEARDQLSIVFHTSEGVQFGFISAKNARPYSRQETFAFSASLIDDDDVGEYGGHLLKKLNCQIVPPVVETTEPAKETTSKETVSNENKQTVSSTGSVEKQQPKTQEEPVTAGAEEQKEEETVYPENLSQKALDILAEYANASGDRKAKTALPGDANQDGKRSYVDGIMVMNNVVGLELLDQEVYYQCDVDGNGIIDIFDAIYIMSDAAGLDKIIDSPFTCQACDGGVEVTGYTGTATELVIPASIEGKAVVRIANGAFKGGNYTSVKIPYTVTQIGSSAFENCASLTNVTVSDNVTVIGAAAFKNCTALSSMTIDNN